MCEGRELTIDQLANYKVEREAVHMLAPSSVRDPDKYGAFIQQQAKISFNVHVGALPSSSLLLLYHWARRSMHQGCLLKGRNFVFYPLFAHLSPSFAHFLRLDARNPASAARSPGENGKESEKMGLGN